MDNYDLKNKEDGWYLTQQGGDTEKHLGGTKEDAIGQASKLLSGRTASLKIHNLDGTIDEERTFPRSAVSRQSEG
jgi:hypothetical protein